MKSVAGESGSRVVPARRGGRRAGSRASYRDAPRKNGLRIYPITNDLDRGLGGCLPSFQASARATMQAMCGAKASIAPQPRLTASARSRPPLYLLLLSI